MDRRFLFPKSLDSDYKLTRAASFSELSKTKKIIIEQQYQSETCGNLVKQYSCEQIFDQKSNTSHVTVSHVLKSANEEHTNIWKTTLPANVPLGNSAWSKENKPLHLQEHFSFPNQQLTLKASDSSNLKPILAPPKFIFEENGSKQLNVKISSDNEQLGESEFHLETPSVPGKKCSILNNEKTIENNIIKEDSCELIKRNSFNSKSTQNVDTSELKKRLRSLVRIEPKKRSNMYLCWSFTFIILLSIATVYLAFFINITNFSTTFCNPRFEVDKIPQDLKNRIYSQETAVNDLTKYFMDKNNKTGFDIIVLVGGIGNGKSYTAEIIKNNMKATSNIVDIFPPLYKREDEVYASLSVCRCNLIRLENLKTDDILDAVMFIDTLKRKANNYCILLLALFNTQETDHNLKKSLDLDKSVSVIDQKFKEKNLQPIMVSYTPMSNEALTKCIQDAANYTNVQLTNDDIEYVRNDLLIAESGCKGAYAKVQLVGKSVREISSEL